ncbi:MAG: ABC transporter substrate-binding protein [Chloroflexota bacterium]
MTDIVGSTDHAAELGDSAWRELVQQHHALIRAALRRHGGREIDTAGDGFFATFDAPAAAVRCAFEIVSDVGKLGLEVRAGIHVGEVEQIGRKVGGITVPIASRIMSGAAPGEVLVSSTVRDLAAGSGLSFEDRSVRELKGVPGEWHVYSVKPAEAAAAAESSGPIMASDRRAAAVRRAAARPIWQRRPRLVGAAVVGLAVIVAIGGLFVWKPWQTPALASVKENSIGIIDASRNEVIGEIPVGMRPGGIAVGDGHAWVSNTGADSVSEIDLAARSVLVRIDVGQAPKGIAVTEGSVWVANSGDRTVSRINTATGRVVDTVEVGNGPTAIAAAGSLLWVANATDSTVMFIVAGTGMVGQPIGVPAAPIALVADESGLWVASEDGASVSHLDPVTGLARAAPIQLAGRPSALALDGDSVWVASDDGTLTRIERATNRVTATVLVGGSLASVAVSGNTVWVGDQDGYVSRLDAVSPSPPARHISAGSAVAALTVVDGHIWLAAQPSAASHRGGTLQIVEARPDQLPRFVTDPLGNGNYSVAGLMGDGLVAYRRTGGTAGSALLPDLATSVPRPTNGGLTYTFQLRQNLHYSTGAPVRASDFRRAIERSFQVDAGFGVWGSFLYPMIQGAEACLNAEGTAAERCDLAAGVVTDDVANTVTFNLSTPDADFVYRLGHAAGYPVPDGVPMKDQIVGTFPGTGPYVVGAMTANELRMTRNPQFEVWDAAVRPDGFPDEIVFIVVEDDAQPTVLVEKGDADYTSSLDGASPELLARLETQYAARFHVGSSVTGFVVMNTSIPPFDRLEARQAVNFAIDRAHMAELRGPGAAVTCQLLPPGFPGYQPYCPHTLRPEAGGHWTAPDMQTAQDLIDVSGTRGSDVTLGPSILPTDDRFYYLAQVLEELGYNVTLDERNTLDFPPGTAWWDADVTQIMINGWFPDWVNPGNFLGLFRCPPLGDSLMNYCDPDFELEFEHALQLQHTDPAAAFAEWAALDRWGVDLALHVPLYNAGAGFVSERVGNYQYNPGYGVLFDQIWVQ